MQVKLFSLSTWLLVLFVSPLVFSSSSPSGDEEGLPETVYGFGANDCKMAKKNVGSDPVMIDCAEANKTTFNTYKASDYAEPQDLPSTFKSFQGSFASSDGCVYSFNSTMDQVTRSDLKHATASVNVDADGCVNVDEDYLVFFSTRSGSKMRKVKPSNKLASTTNHNHNNKIGHRFVCILEKCQVPIKV